MIYDRPINMLSDKQEIIFIIVSLPKLIYELSIVVIFICLFKKFIRLSQDYQAEQKAQASNLILYSKILAIIVCTLYLINTILFNVVSPLLLYFNWEEE